MCRIIRGARRLDYLPLVAWPGNSWEYQGGYPAGKVKATWPQLCYHSETQSRAQCPFSPLRLVTVSSLHLSRPIQRSLVNMSQIPPTATSSTDFETIFTDALKLYNKKTKKDIASHPLAAQLQSCDSSSAILAVLRAQVQVNDQAQSAIEKWTKWLDPTVTVVSAFSAVLKVTVAGTVITRC